jgi:hypothetical protein
LFGEVRCEKLLILVCIHLLLGWAVG